MNKKTIVTALFALVACIQSFSHPPLALPIWERKSVPAVILGRYVDREPGDKDKHPDFWGNNESLKGASPEITTDSVAGTFTFVWDICYPLKHNFVGWSVMLFPGDTVRVDFNKNAFEEYQTYNKETPRDSITTSKLQELWKKAIHIEGASFELPLPIHMKDMQLGFPREYATAHYHDTVDEWREVCWEEFQDVVKQLDSIDLSPKEKEYQRMLIEQDYLRKLGSYTFSKNIWDLTKDPDSLAMFEKQFTFKDPHAPELTYYRNTLGFLACLKYYGFDDGKLYIQANGLEDSPLGRWFKELDEAKTVMAQAKANQPVDESELNALSPEFQVQIREVQALLKQEAAGNEGKRRDLPEGEPQEWLPKIVDEHKGHIVFVDFWATWCGPCRRGMKEMEAVKDELTERGVDFVYITDTSSDTNEWVNIVAQHAGDHYIVPKDKKNEMQIPEYDDAIPHYLIYDREGKFVKAIRGWSGVEDMMNELAKLTSPND